MKTFKLRLVSDKTFPMFKRLRWEFADVSLPEILEHGIHPWMDNTQPYDMAEAFLDRLNETGMKPAALIDHQLNHDLTIGPYNQWNKKSRFEQALDCVHSGVFFCESTLNFQRLLDIAQRKLQEEWHSGLALRLAERLHPGFQDLRRFLKSKSKRVKLSGYTDLSQYNWADILSLDDFRHHERLLIEYAIDALNFRANDFLGRVTDAQGRLRLAPSIDQVTLTHRSSSENVVPVLWEAARKGGSWRMRPNIGASRSARQDARKFALRWRRDRGRLCFRAETGDIVDMVSTGEATPSFPALRYTSAPSSPSVAATVAKGKVEVFHLGVYPRQGWNGEHLKEILRSYEVPVSGTKKVLVVKLSKLAAEQYKEHEALLDEYFTENRFVRVAGTVRHSIKLPVLGEDDVLRGLTLTLYALRHLRGNVVIDAAYLNNSCSEQELAHALLTDRISLDGGFVRTN